MSWVLPSDPLRFKRHASVLAWSGPFAYRPRVLDSPPMSDSATACLDTVRCIAPDIRGAADRIEQDRRVPAELVQALAAAGVFRLCVPRALGGVEAHPETMIAVLETIAHADGSAGWSAMIGATSGVAS